MRACHLQPTVAVTAIATALALAAGQGASATLVAAAVLTGQLSVGWSNDYLDRERDRSAGRTDKPVAAGEVSATAVGTAAVAALVACVPLSFASGPTAGVVHLVAVGAGWAYNWRLKATVASVVPYVVAFGALPVFVTTGLPGAPLPAPWVIAAGALLGAGAHFVNALPDRDDDARSGICGLPQRMSASGSLLVGVGLLGSAAALVAVGPPGGFGIAGATLATASAVTVIAVVVAVRVGRERTAWSLTLTVALLCVAGLIAGGDQLVG